MARIVVTGGGSGGHITPVLAVAYQLKQLRPDSEIVYIGQTGDSLGDIPAKDPSVDAVYTVRAGKIRRYHGEGLRQLFDMPTTGKNIRDVGFVVAGLWQSYRLLRKLRPDVVFIKGGFVGVPVGLAAAMLGIPFVTHDSDAMPGLANRVISKWASRHAVALPKDVYAYPPDKTVTVGVPISHHYRQYTSDELAVARQRLGYATDRVLLVTGGGLGADRLNKATLAAVPDLLATHSTLRVVHVAGRNHQTQLSEDYDRLLADTVRSRVTVLGFVNDLYDYSAIADVVVTRAGGTAMAEFAAQSKACVVVPNPLLTGGHQLKNAQVLADRQAVVIVTEESLHTDPHGLYQPVDDLLSHPEKCSQLAAQLHTLAYPDSARQLAMVLLEVAAKDKTLPVGTTAHEATRQDR